jgi:hypothetical protein
MASKQRKVLNLKGHTDEVRELLPGNVVIESNRFKAEACHEGACIANKYVAIRIWTVIVEPNHAYGECQVTFLADEVEQGDDCYTIGQGDMCEFDLKGDFLTLTRSQ